MKWKVSIKISDTESVEVSVSGVFENHIENYILMTENTYRNLFNKEANYKNAFVSSYEENTDKVAEALTDGEDIAAVSSTKNIRDMVGDMMQSINYNILLVLACAMALALVVIYNLNNINITERTREIATLKVLGFYPNETYSYVYRENIVITAIGILVGLGLGKILHTFIMNQLQVDFVSFKQQVFPLSYFIAIIVTFLLTIIVNRILRGKIDNINMAESLKFVE